MTNKWNRRRFLQAAGIGASAAAFAPLFPLPKAAAVAGPKRIVFVTTALGTDMSRWTPTGTENDFELSEQLTPLAAYKDRLLILDGIDIKTAYQPTTKAGGHAAMSSLWTGMPIMDGRLTDQNIDWPQGPSVDRLIAAHVGEGAAVDAFYWGTWRTSKRARPGLTPNQIAHHAAASRPITTEFDPMRAFDRLFQGVTGDAAELERLRRRRGSVLDAVRGSLTRLRSELPAGDRERLDQHLQSVRELEEDLGRVAPMCVPPVRPEERPNSFLRNDANHDRLSRMHFDLMNVALACDLTRVACFHWYVSDLDGTSLGVRDAIHADTHAMDRPGRQASRDNLSTVQTWHARTLAEGLLDRMSDEVADNTTLVWGSNMSEGKAHSCRNIPLVIYQGANLDYFRTGRYLRWGDAFNPADPHADTGGESMNKVLVSLCHAMGATAIDQVGDPTLESGPLEALR